MADEDVGLPVLIQELEGARRVLRLEDHDLPERGVEIGGELRSVVTWYPGRSNASVQVMGTQEEPITLEGWFRDGDAMIDGHAMERYQAGRNIWLGQRLCQLEWGDLVRRGRIKSFTGIFDGRADVRYRLVFQVEEADEAVIVTRAVIAEPAPSGFSLAALLDALDALAEAANTAAALANAAQAVV